MSSMGQQNSKKALIACVGDKPQEREAKRESEVKAKLISSCFGGNSSDIEHQIERGKVANNFSRFHEKSSESDSHMKGAKEKLSKITDNKLFPFCCDGTDSTCESRAEHQQNAKKPFMSCFGGNSEDDESQADTGKKNFLFGFHKTTSSNNSNLKEDAKVKYSEKHSTYTSLPLSLQAGEATNIQSLCSSPHSKSITEESIHGSRQYSPLTHSRSKSDTETTALFSHHNFTDIATRRNSDSIRASPRSTPQSSRSSVCGNNGTSNQVERPSFELMSKDGSLRLYSRSTLTLIDSSGVQDEERIQAYLNNPFSSKGAPSFTSSYDCSSNESDNVFVYDYEESPDLITSFQSARIDPDSNFRPRERDSGYVPYSKSSKSHYHERGDKCNHIMAPPPTPNSMGSNSEISPIEISPPENLIEGYVVEQRRVSADDGYFQEISGVQEVSNSCVLPRNAGERYLRGCSRQDATLSYPNDYYTSTHAETSKGKPVASSNMHPFSRRQNTVSCSNDSKSNNPIEGSQVSSKVKYSQMAPDLTPSLTVSYKKQLNRICEGNLPVAFRNIPSQVISCDRRILSNFLNSQKISCRNLLRTSGEDYTEASTEDILTDNANLQFASGPTYPQRISQKSHRETHKQMGFENRHPAGIPVNQLIHLVPEKAYTSENGRSQIISKKNHVYESGTLPNHFREENISTLYPGATSDVAKPKSETVGYNQCAHALNAVNKYKEFSLNFDDHSHPEYSGGYQKKANHPQYLNLPQIRTKPRRRYHRKYQRSKSADSSADSTLTYYSFIDGPLADYFEQDSTMTTRQGPIGAEKSDSKYGIRRRYASADYAY